MSNFHFLKKDLEWKIVKTQCLGPTTHIPHNPHTPQPTSGTLSSSLLINRSKKNTIYSCTLTSCAKRAYTHRLFVRPSPSLFYTCSREKISPSWEPRNEWQIEIWVTTILAPLPRIHRFFVRHIFSLEQQLKRENYTHTIIPRSWELKKWVTNWDMSGKSF